MDSMWINFAFSLAKIIGLKSLPPLSSSKALLWVHHAGGYGHVRLFLVRARSRGRPWWTDQPPKADFHRKPHLLADSPIQACGCCRKLHRITDFRREPLSSYISPPQTRHRVDPLIWRIAVLGQFRASLTSLDDVCMRHDQYKPWHTSCSCNLILTRVSSGRWHQVPCSIVQRWRGLALLTMAVYKVV